MNPVFFFAFLIFSALTYGAIQYPSPWNYGPVIFVFLFIPLMDLLLGQTTKGPNLRQQQKWKKTAIWSSALYCYCLTHFLLLYLALKMAPQLQWTELLFLSLNLGLYTGGLGITVAHELCHKRNQLQRRLADLLLITVCYQHFAIEHVKGHHLNVATAEDPASARKNETIYSFLIRTIIGSYQHALKIQFSAVLIGTLASMSLIGILIWIHWKMALFFLLQSMVAIILLELVNYVEHYGLSRKKEASGHYEKVQPIHSWNSNHIFSNLILFNLQRHSDHHARANLPYVLLQHQETAPSLPSGYPSMILLTLIPPLWFRIMNPRLDSYSH